MRDRFLRSLGKIAEAIDAFSSVIESSKSRLARQVLEQRQFPSHCHFQLEMQPLSSSFIQRSRTQAVRWAIILTGMKA